MTQHQMILVGQPFPGPVPQQEGAVLELGLGPDEAMTLLVQIPRQKAEETAALKTGFTKYAYFESGKSSLACWVWDFPAPFSYFDSPFHSGRYGDDDDRVKRFINSDNSQLMVYVLDGPIVKAINIVHLHHDSVDFFRDTLRNQRKITDQEFNDAIADLYTLTPEEIFEAGTQFEIKKA
jgi:hypothetical protein